MKVYLAAVGHQQALQRAMNERNPANILLSYYDLSGLAGPPFRRMVYREMIDEGILYEEGNNTDQES